MDTTTREQLLRTVLAKRLQKDASSRLASAKDNQIPVIDRNQNLRLSFSQQRLWFLSQMDGFGEAYHMPMALRLRGELNVHALRSALNRIVFRHEALRTTFRRVEDEPVQHIAPADCGLSIQEHDLSQHSQAAMALAQRTHEEANRPFDMEHGPLFRGQLIRMNESEHMLLLTLHHIVTDGWSNGILINELSTLYRSYDEGRDDPLPPLPIQFADYAMWQRDWLSGDVLEKQSQYWRRTLAGAPTFLELPTDRPRPAEQTFDGDRVKLELDATLTSGLKALSRRHGMTLYMAVLAAWATVLSRLSGQDEVVIGTPVANRSRPELEGLIGFFVSTQAIRVEVSGSVVELLNRVRGQVFDAQEHQALPFEHVVEIIKPPRSLSHTPIFQAMLAWEISGTDSSNSSDLSMSFVGSAFDVAKFDLTLNLGENGDRIVGGLDYATALFDRSTIERQMGYLRRVLAAMVADEQQPVDLIELLDDEERHSLLALGDGGPGVECASVSLYDLVAEQAARTPNAIAVIEPGAELSYSELTQRVNGLAEQLRQFGAGPECRVAILADRSVESIIGVLAILAAGAAYVPLDPTYPDDRLAYVLNDAAVLALIAPTGLAERAAVGKTLRPELSDKTLVIADAPIQEFPPAMAVDAGNAAYVIYTSGSTGVPKGVVVEHRSAMNLVQSFIARHDFSGHRLLMIPPLIFDASVGDVFPLLAVGATLVLHPAPSELGSIELSRFCRQQQITAIDAPAAMWRQWTDGFVEMSTTDNEPVLPDLRLMMFGGEAVSLEQVKRFAKLTDNRVVLSNHYGPTEASVCATMLTTRDGTELSGAELSIGQALPGVQVYVLDSHSQLVPRGVEGELCIGGVQVARGYLNRPELTAEHFVRNPFASNTSSDETARLYRTGDLVRWNTDGKLQYVGRRDHQVKIRGFRVELSEIEVSLTLHPSISGAVVLAREDVPGDKRLVAYVTANEAAIDIESLRTHLSGVLPDYMVPAAYVQLDALPLTPNGKLDRKALPAPDASAYVTRSYEAPMGEVETALAQIWADVLKLDRVGRHDNFFELGGHSLLAVTVIERMKRANLHADVRALFSTQTLMALAAEVSGESDTIVVPPNLIPLGCTDITPAMLPLVSLSQEDVDNIVSQVPGGVANIQDIYPLAPLQEGIFFHHVLERKGDVYLAATLLSTDSREHLNRYVEALQAVIQRHDVLRTAVVWEGLTDPLQVVLRHAPLLVEQVQLDSADGDIAEQLRARFDPRHYRLDVRQAPIMRLFFAEDTANHRWVVLEMMHHLMGDHATLAVMQEEIQAHLSGHANSLPEPLQFRNFVAQARLGVSSEEHEEFFTQLLSDIDEPTDPFGLQDVRGDGSRIVEARCEVDLQLCLRLRACARTMGVSVASMCHLAWAQVLARICGRDEVVFGTVMLGRMQGGEGTGRGMGMFINTLPVRMQIGDESARTSIRKMHDLLTQLLRHEHAPLALVQRCSAVRAPAPLFTALLNYRHASDVIVEQDAQNDQAWAGMEFLGGGERTNYPIGLSIDDFGSGLSLDAQVDEAIDPQRLCAFMLTALESLTTALEQAPTTSVRCLEILPGTERQQLLVNFNDTTTPYPQQQCIHELFETQVTRTPNATALVFEDQTLSYGELNKRANQLAHHLIGLGVKPDDRVAICVERSLEMVVGLLGILKAGGAYVPLDPSYPADRLIYMLEDSAPVAMLTSAIEQTAVLNQLVGLASAIPIRDLIIDAGDWSSEPQGNPPLEKAGLTSRNLAYVIYTSGSSGTPKGVMVEHRSLINLWACLNERVFQDLPTNLRVGLNAAFSFDASLQSLSQLLSGHCLVLIPQDVRTDSNALLQLLQRQNIQIFDCTPVQLDLLLAAGLLDDRMPYQALAVLVGGEAISAATWATLKQSSTTDFYNVYGPTECTVDATICALRSASGMPIIGRPIANTQIYILDAHHQPAPLGVVGELYIGGACLARGYLNRPELTAERFIPDPFSAQPQARMYKTGDLGRWLPDGNIEFIGRNDFQVKIRGFRIELGEIEARLSEHSSVREAVVLVREDAPGDKRLAAYVTSMGDISTETLRAHLISLLPEHMVPAAYVHLDAFPVTPNGKLDRKALPAPDGTSYVTRGYEAPAGEAETTIAQIWAKVLKLERVGRHDNFFELGGHSLSAIGLVAALQRHFDAQISDIFRWPSVIEQAQHFQPSGDALRQRVDRVKKSLLADTERYHQMMADSVLQATISAYKQRIEQDLELLSTQQKICFECVLLTGCSGYLGAYLLYELVTTRHCRVVAPVRGIDQKDAERRLHEVLDHYFGSTFYSTYSHQIEVVVADLSETNLGMAPEIYARLSNEVDTIIHSAGNVRHYGPYEDFHSANVVSTEQLLTLALDGRSKRFHYISTVSTGDGVANVPWAVFTEHDVEIGQEPGNVYVLSKLVAERLVVAYRQRGVIANIHRVGNITYHSRTGVLQKNITENAFFQRTKACITLKVVPTHLNTVELTFVDQLARTIILLSEQADLKNEIFHLSNPHHVQLAQLLNESTEGLGIREIEPETFLDSLLELRNTAGYEDAVMNMLLHTGLLEEEASSAKPPLVIRADRTERLLARLGYAWPEPDPMAIRQLVRFAIDGSVSSLHPEGVRKPT